MRFCWPVAESINHRAPSPESRLAAAVIRVALEDAHDGDQDARHWLLTSAAVRLWAEALQVAPERLVVLARAVITARGAPVRRAA